jgi:hypothetical protein
MLTPLKRGRDSQVSAEEKRALIEEEVEQNEAESASTLLNHITHHIRWA